MILSATGIFYTAFDEGIDFLFVFTLFSGFLFGIFVGRLEKKK
jgi:hypothetical protein